MFAARSRLSTFSFLGLSALTLSLLIASSLGSCAATEDGGTPAGGNQPNDPSKAATVVANSPGRNDPVQDSNAALRQQEGAATLDAQRRNLLIDMAVSNAKALVAQGRLEDAETELLRARDIDPDRPAVNDLLTDVQAQLGRRPGEVQSYAQRMAQLQEIKEQKARSDAQGRIDAGKKAMQEGDYRTALQNFRTVQVQIEAGRQINWGGLEGETKALIDQAEKERAQKEAGMVAAAEREAFERLKKEEELRAARKRDSVRRLMAKATKAFENRQFADARQFGEEVLKIDPQNEAAKELYASSEKGLRDSRMDDYFRAKAEDTRKWLEANQELKTPYNEILTAPDADKWARLDAIRKTGQPIAGRAMDPATAEIDEKLRTLTMAKLSYTEENGDFEQVVKDLQTITRLPVLITQSGKEAITADNVKVVLTLDHPIKVKNFLDIITTRFSDKLGWFIRDGAVFIGTKSEALGDTTVQTHDIHDLIFPVTNFAGPKIKEIPIEGQADTGPDADVPRSGGIVGDAFKFVDPEALVAAIKETVSKETWEDTRFKIEAVHGNLLVIHTPIVQGKIAGFLDDLRRFHAAVVTIESKFLSVSQNWLQQVGVDIRGLGGPGNKGTVAQLDDITNGLDDNASRGLDNAGTGDVAGHPVSGAFFNDGGDGDVRARTENFSTSQLGRILSPIGGATIGLTILDDTELNILIRAVEKSAQAQIVNQQTLTVMNNQRANISIVNLTTYIQDFGVEVAQAAFIADPQVNVIQDGIVLDVRPVIHYDRKYITLDLQPTVAELKRPIPTFTTSLAGATLPVTLQLPQMTVRSAATTVKVPDGGSVLIGGLREILNRERRNEVPWLARLPIVSVLFKEEGVADENQSLMVLVRARVTDVKDAMKKTAARR